MKQIRLIAEDFDRLDIPCGNEGTGQYSNGFGCPIFKALTRKGYSDIIVWPRSVEIGRRVIQIEGDYLNVEAVRKSLLAGAKYGIIKVLNDNPKKRVKIESILVEMWRSIGMDNPINSEDIVEYCYEDVCASADPYHWSEGDVAIAFRRWIEDQTK